MPQIEIMMADLPHTLYKTKGTKPKESDVEDAERRMKEAYERKRRMRENEGFTIDEIFSGKDLDDKS